MTKSTVAKGQFDRRGVLKGMGAFTAGLAASPLFLSVKPARADSFEVNLQLGWLASNGITGEICADAKGFYADGGIELKVTPGGPGVDGVASVASNAAQMGQLSSSPSLMLARSAGIPVKCIACGYQKHPFTYFSLEDNPIRSPQDMIGKTIATQPTARILLRALLAHNNIAEDQVTVVNMGSDMNQIMSGQAQAVTGWQTNVNALSILGDKRVDLMLWDTGIQLYANVYYVTDDMLADHSDVLARYVKATAKGWAYAHANREEAAKLLVEAYPNLDLASEQKALELVLGFSFDAKTKAGGWGVMEPANWQKQIDSYANLDQFEGDVPKVTDVMTMEILEATAADRPKIG
ncbi:MAG: ABC transporter substrate-binding protein [Kiloniellales bacterium]|nr:ABC transporter substrate-binding protein [Kiloniellales bacterium]